MDVKFLLPSRRVIFGLACALLLSGCAEKQAIAVRSPSEVLAPVPQLSKRPSERTAFRPSLLDLPLRKQVRAKPIPDRLLVQIAPSEIADSFRPESIGCRPTDFVEVGLMPGNLGTETIRYRGVTRDGQAAFSAHVRGTISESAIRRDLEGSKGRLIEVVKSGRPGEPATDIIVAFDSREIDSRWTTLCDPDYFYLKKISSLNHVLREIGAVSMRRVFRSLEQPDSSRPGYFTVRKFKDVLEAAKAANSKRTARAYTWKDLNEERAAREYPGPVRIPFSIEGMGIERILERESLKAAKPSAYDEAARRAGLLEPTDMRVPDNMENWFLLRLKPGVDLHAALARLQQLSTLQRASLDYPFRPAQVNDPEWNDQWGLRNSGTFQGSGGGVAGFDIGIVDAWNSPPAAQPIIVAVIDTGIKEDLNEFAGRFWSNECGPGETPSLDRCEIAGNGLDDNCNGYIDDVHGITTYDRFAIDYSASPACSVSPGGPSTALDPHATGTAGVIAAATNNSAAIAGTAGTDPVELMNIALGRFSGRLWPPGWSEFAEAMFYAISPMPDGSTRGADIVNMSVITSSCGYLGFESIYAALDAGLILVGAAGNDAVRFDVDEEGVLGVFPASVPGVITVGGSSRNGRWWPSSNYGPGLDLVAPAHEVRTSSYDPNAPGQTSASVVTASGTSVSAAFVSGTAAVILGRYPGVTAPYMRHWLRAKATDMLDPLGDGSSHVGDDEWTGAGMLNARAATTALSNANDQPVVVDLAVTRSKDFAGYYGWGFPGIPLAVGGQPDLGIRVQGTSLSNWSLSYGVGDAPTSTTWFDIPVTPSSLTQQEVDFAWVTGGIVPSGRDYLDTDVLANRQVYTVRLQAENRAGTKFTAYDYIVPTRAKLLFPPKNWTLVPEWGWLPVAGVIDTRPSSNVRIELYDDLNQLVWDTGLQTLWNPSSYTPPHLAERTPTVAHPLLSNFKSFFASADGFPTASAGIPEGWHEYRLTVNSSAGSEQDTVRFYADASNFSADRWDLRHESIGYQTSYGTEDLADRPLSINIGRENDALLVSDGAGMTAPRLFLQAGKSVMALDRNGALIWEQRPLLGPPYHYNFRFAWNMVISDVDGDGSREILYAVTEPTALAASQDKLRVFLLSADSGTPFSNNWPKEFSRQWQHSPGHLAAADVLGDSEKEIILAEPRRFYYGIPEEDLTPATIRILDLNGNELWSREFPLEIPYVGPLETADIDGDGKEDIVLAGTGQILKGNNIFLAGWNTAAQFSFRAMVGTGTGAAVDLLVRQQNELLLKAPDGTTRNGWPVQAAGSVAVAQIVLGGAEEIIVCGDTIQVFDAAGAPVGAAIAVDGTCSSVLSADVDGDGTDELLALVQRYKENPAPNERQGSFIEAYKLDGTRLADSDTRWPVIVAPRNFWGYVRYPEMNRQVAIGDVDGDTRPEVVQVLTIFPYGMDWFPLAPSAQIEVLHLQ